MRALQEESVLWIFLSPEEWALGFTEEEFSKMLKKSESPGAVGTVVLEGQGARALTTRGLKSLQNAVQLCLRRGWKPLVWVSHPMRLIFEKMGLSRLVSIQTSPDIREDTFPAVSDLEKDWLWGTPEESL